MKKAVRLIRDNLELLIWIAAFFALFFIQPNNGHFTLCPLSNLGFDGCPGCGIGHSIHYAMHLDLVSSFLCHPFGPVAMLILLKRIFTLTNQFIINTRIWTTDFSK